MPDVTGPAVVVRALPPGRQWALRARCSGIEKIEAAWGAPLDLQPLASSFSNGRHALRLGPDEWLLLAESAVAVEGLQSLALTMALSLVDLSDQQLAWEISGENAPRVLAAGCPLDLSDANFPSGRATRTIYGHAEVVLWRPGAEAAWQIRALRSFAGYLIRHLDHAVGNLQRPDDLR